MQLTQYFYLYGIDPSKKDNLVIYTHHSNQNEKISSLRGLFVSTENLESKLLCGNSTLDFSKDQMKEIEEEYNGEFINFK